MSLAASTRRPVLVDFTAAWCRPCIALSPIIAQIAGEQENTLTVVQVDVDANPGLVQQFGLLSMPTLILFQDG